MSRKLPAGTDLDRTHRMPAWVKAFLAVALVLALVLLVSLVSGGDHGPGRHGHAPAARRPG